MGTIKSVPTAGYQACDNFNSDTWGQPEKQSITGIKVGASGASTDAYWSDINDFWYQSGHPESTATWSGTNGNNHYSVRQFGGTTARYLTGHHVVGVQLYENNNSTASSGLYVRAVAVGITNGSSFEWYDLFGKMNRPKNYGRTLSATFNSTLLNRIKGGWYIERFMAEITSAPSGTKRTTQTTVQNLKFMTTGTAGGNLILPVKRTRSNASSTNWIG